MAYGPGWVWTAPGPAWVGAPAADDTHVAFTYGHQHLVLLDAAGRRRWDTYRLGLRDVAPRLGTDLVLSRPELISVLGWQHARRAEDGAFPLDTEGYLAEDGPGAEDEGHGRRHRRLDVLPTDDVGPLMERDGVAD